MIVSIEIILVQDHKLTRSDIHAFLVSRKDVELIASVCSGQEAIESGNKLSPDIIIIDIDMPNTNGLEVTRRIKTESPSLKIIALSKYPERTVIEAIMKAGASGFILKEVALEELNEAIDAVYKNEKYLSPKVVTLLIDGYLKSDVSSEVAKISKREREVLVLITQGLQTKMMAHRLNLSVKTIESHRAHIMKKLKIFSIAELTKFAIREGLATID